MAPGTTQKQQNTPFFPFFQHFGVNGVSGIVMKNVVKELRLEPALVYHKRQDLVQEQTRKKNFVFYVSGINVK